MLLTHRLNKAFAGLRPRTNLDTVLSDPWCGNGVWLASLGGFGRSDHPGRWGAAVFMQIINPEAFGGRAAFARESGYLAQLCRRSRVPEGAAAVRMPGERALAMRRQALVEGVLLQEAIMPALAPWSEKFGLTPPASR